MLAAIIKDLQLLLRDRGALLSMFALPVVFIAVFGSMFPVGEDRGAPREIALWSAGDDAVGTRVAGSIDASRVFRATRRGSPDDVRAAVARDQVRAGVIVPVGFSIATAGRAPIELVLDEGAPLAVRGPLEGALRSLIARGVLGMTGTADALIAVRTPPGIERPLAGITAFQVAVPGNSVLFGFFLALTVALSLVEEQRSGTWRRVLAAPVRRSAILAAKLVPFVLLGMLQFLFLFGLGALAFGMKVGGSVLALAVQSTAVVVCATALGLAIAALGGTQKQVGSIGSICLLVMGLLGGAMVPRLQMPEPLATLAHGVPHSWALDGFYTLLVRDGAGLADVAGPIAAVLAFAAGFAVFGLLRFRFEP